MSKVKSTTNKGNNNKNKGVKVQYITQSKYNDLVNLGISAKELKKFEIKKGNLDYATKTQRETYLKLKVEIEELGTFEHPTKGEMVFGAYCKQK